MSEEPQNLESQGPRSGWRRFALIAGGIALLALIIGGLYLASRPVPEQIQGMIDTNDVRVAVKAPARVIDLGVDVGAHVRRGQVLAVVSSPEIDAAIAQVERARAANRLAQATERRTESLFRQGVVPEQRRDEAHANALSARETLTAAQAQVAAIIDGARYSERGLEVLAPAEGEIATRAVSVGELAPAGYPLFTMITTGEYWVTLNVREDQLHGLRIGAEIEGTTPALQKRLRFRIDYIAAEGDFATWRAVRQSSGYDVRSFEVRARPVESVQGLRPGMSVLFDAL